ncbi:hypothetical protein BH10PLA1_BH10PLA1_13860 [soil metagenome]
MIKWMRGNQSARKAVRRSVGVVIESLEDRLQLSTSIVSYRNDTTSIGVNPNEAILTPANVNTSSFGKLFTVPLDGQVYAEPLVDTGITITSGVNTTAGATGLHNVTYVATENDTLYAIDTASGAVLWQRSFLDTTNPSGNVNNTLGATAITAVPNADVGSSDVAPRIGITSTPVIDHANGLLYVVTKTKETINSKANYVQRIHAISLANGTDVVAPQTIGQTIGATTHVTPIYVYGTGDGSIIDPYNGTGKSVVQFNALREAQRDALSLVNGRLYIAWASHGDSGPVHGWVCSWDVTNLATKGFVLNGVLNTSPNNGLAGIWQGGGQLAFEADGSAFYFSTGNGFDGAPVLGANGLPNNANYNEALVKAVIDTSTTATNQGPNGWGLKVTDFFTPANVVNLDNADSDFGSGAPIILPDSAGIANHPHLLVVGGKDGRLFLLDRDNLGHFDANGDHALNAVVNGNGKLTAPNLVSGLLSTPAWFNGKLYAVSGYTGPAYAFTITSTGQIKLASQSTDGSFGYIPGSPMVSANGTTNGVVWAVDTGSNILHAFDANTMATELWNSSLSVGGSDNLGAAVKFAVPTVANGQVFVGTQNSLVVYGLALPATQSPKTPVLAATTLSGSSINLTWTDASQSPNAASIYYIEQSADGYSFSPIATAPAGATSIAIGGLNSQTKYYFRIRGNNSFGTSSYSNIANATTSNQSALIDYSQGFSGTSLALNGKAAVNGSSLRLTDGGKNEASSAYVKTPVDVTQFKTSFTFKLSSGSSIADGFTFVLQNAGTSALGTVDGGLGSGPPSPSGSPGIGKSIAIKFDLYSNSGEGKNSTGLYTNGASPTSGATDLTSSGINLHSGHVMQVDLSYDGAELIETITDTQTNAVFTKSYQIDIAGIVGGNTAYAGFTGGSGGITAVQDILTWTYSPKASVSPNTPSGLGATAASATSVSLSWQNNATNQTGYHLDRATDAAFTQNLITATLPSSPANFVDTATGIAPGSTYYYRLRAFNSAGDSGNSNSASVTIPFAPEKPSNQQIVNVLADEIDLSWQDNAGHSAQGYLILRAINHGDFTTVADLPPTSRPAPSTYAWNDTDLTPGTYYEYHIQAYNVAGHNDFAGVNATTLTLPPSNVTAVQANNLVSLSWSTPTGAMSYNVYRGETAGGESLTPMATGITATNWDDTTAVNGVTYFYTVTAVNLNSTYVPALPSESAFSNEASPSVAPADMLNHSYDIGAAKIGGSSSFSNGVYTVKGAGSGIQTAADQFQYDYANLNGNVTLIANVSSLTNTGAQSRAGVMVRSTTSNKSTYVAVSVTGSGQISFDYRTKFFGSVTSVTVTTSAKWVKVVRSGNVFTGYYSVDGNAWTQIGPSVTMSLDSAITAGLIVTSSDTTKLTTATFANVNLAGSVLP